MAWWATNAGKVCAEEKAKKPETDYIVQIVAVIFAGFKFKYFIVKVAHYHTE